MTFLRSLSSALGRLAHTMQGQDVERPRLAGSRRHHSDSAAITRAHFNQGLSSIGMGR